MSSELDSFGYDSNSFDIATQSSILPKDLRKKVNATIPDKWSSQWQYFYEGQISFLLYLIIFVITAYIQCIETTSFTLKCISTIFNAFGWIGLIGIGHEAAHNSIAPSRHFFGKIINFIYKYTLLPLFVSSPIVWNIEHNINHHKTVNQIVDTQNLIGNNFTQETFYSMFYFLKYFYLDILVLFNSKYSLLERIWSIIGAMCRLYMVFVIGYKQGGIWIIILKIYFIIFFANYFVYLSHSIPVRSKKKVTDYFTLQLRETWDIMPQSKVSQFFHFGFGAHASHHIFGYLPRSLLYTVSKILKENCANEYREIDSIYGEWMLFWNRHKTM